MAAMKEWRSATVLADDLVGHLVNRFIESSRFDCSIKEMNGWTGELNHSHFSSWTLKNFPQWAAIFSAPHQICRSPGDEMLRPTIKNTIQHTSSPLWKEKKMKRCTGEKRAAVTVIPLLASTRKKKRKMNNTFHCRPLQTGNKRIPYSVRMYFSHVQWARQVFSNATCTSAIPFNTHAKLAKTVHTHKIFLFSF